MLTLRSYRDYPVAFAEGRGGDFLSLEEGEEWKAVKPGRDKTAWLLSRIAAKELVQRYCDVKLRFVPEITDISILTGSNGEPRVIISQNKNNMEPDLVVSFATASNFVVTCLRPRASGEMFSVALAPVRAQYPYAGSGNYTEREWEQVRFSSAEEADRVLSGLDTLKEAISGATHTSDGVSIERFSLRGDCHLVATSSARVHGAAWYFEHHVMALALSWQSPHTGPISGARVEEEPVLPESRHSEMTL